MIDWRLLIGTFLLSSLLTLLTLRLSSAVGLVQVPNERSSHSVTTPNGGGLGIVLASTFSGYWLVRNDTIFLIILGIGLLLALLGLANDIKNLSVSFRLVIQVSLVALLLVVIRDLPALEIGGYIILSGWSLLVFALVGGVWWINLFNFMDGIDGLASLQAIYMLVMATVTMLWVDLAAVDYQIWGLAVSVSIATFVFLLFNWPPARVFMGDVGSTWLGFIIFSLALLSVQANLLSYNFWLVLAAVFVTDSTMTLLKRMACGERWLEPHSTHAYQQISRRQKAKSLWRRENIIITRETGQRRVILGILAINLFWLAPLAILTLVLKDWGWFIVLIAYAPLILFMALLWQEKVDFLTSSVD